MRHLAILLALAALIAAACGDDQQSAQPTPAPAPAEQQQQDQPASAAPPATQAQEQEQQVAQEQEEPNADDESAAARPAAPTVNVRSGGIDEYIEGVDYFPEKATVLDAENFVVSYHDHYKRVTVLEPNPEADPVEYILVQRGAPMPDDIGDASVIEVPIESIFTSSTTHLPALEIIGALDRLTGVAQGKLISSEAAYARVESGEAAVFAADYSIDAEIVVANGPQVLMTSDFADGAYDVIRSAGTAVVHNGDWVDATALGRAEWVKFIALFFNAEADAEAWYAGVRERYEEAKALVAEVPERPTVHTGIVYGGIWYASGGRSYVARLLADAGADYVWRDDESTGSIQTDIERQLAQAGAAEYWLHGASWWTDSAAALAEDSRYGEFRSLREGNVWNNTKAVNARDGNDVFETGAARPDLVLRDLIAIFHPELLPDHEIRFYVNLAPPPAERSGYSERPAMTLKEGVAYYATFTMADRSTFEAELFAEDAPITVNSFVFLAREGFYDGLTFHRVIDGFVAQGGDPLGNGTGGPGYNIPLELSERVHVEGALAMARAADPDSAGSQFYIALDELPFLDGNYAVFGQIVSGMEAVRAIPQGEPPAQPGVIESITISER